ncbi:Uncharacterized protein ChrSV_1419 [Chromobacterium vaccinii]|nr:Uncharacterized protein ChrSW_1419 [Chromobacterium vaccinii]QND88877.1 Uncharacterized protein ChrSV_1419 [Chromobacterium vaccinii]
MQFVYLFLIVSMGTLLLDFCAFQPAQGGMMRLTSLPV